MKRKRITVYEVYSPIHGRCLLRTMTEALDHVRYTLRVEQEDVVRITRKYVGADWFESLSSCEPSEREE